MSKHFFSSTNELVPVEDTDTEISISYHSQRGWTLKPYSWVLKLIVLATIFALGVGVGVAIVWSKYHVKSEGDSTTQVNSTTVQDTRYKKHKDILMQMNADNIGKKLRYLTLSPHLPGSERNKKLANDIAEKWKKSGFDKTEIFKYNILLSFPKAPGEISLLKNGKVEKKLTIGNEPAIDNSEKKEVVWPFNAFSAKGHVTGELVYGNYGTESDFNTLESLGVNVKGKIMIFRYGKTSRSRKVYRSEKRGVIGVILFSDPYDMTYPGMEYPHGWMMNKDAVQRGTINRLHGDALSLGYPSKDNYFRIKKSKYSGNPTIPSQPISASSAYDVLRFMNDDSVKLPPAFKGGLNLTYVLMSGSGRTVTLNVNTSLETKESLTVCTQLYGDEEPDRFVMIGNHRDAWTFGAADPSSGTSAMMEIVRTLGEYKKVHGWRPRRSLMACSWGSEEPGILGSTEWADENHKFLVNHVVSYLNVDMAVEGNFTVRLRTLDSLVEGVFAAAKNIPAPDNPFQTLYDDWLLKSKLVKKDKRLERPMHSMLSSGSDYRQLWHSYGTASADFRYYFNKMYYPRLPQNGQYHTRYDSYGWMSKFVDPGFTHHLAIGRLMAGHALVLADATILPIDLVKYTKQVQSVFSSFENAYNGILSNHSISLTFAKTRLQSLVDKAKEFHEAINGMDTKVISSYVLRSINDRLMNFERNFLLHGVTDLKSASHVVYGSTYDALKSTKFPGISKAIYEASKDPSSDWDEVRKQVTFVVWCFDTAIRSLEMFQVKA